MARGNPYARGGDVMKTRSERRKEKKAKLAKTNRVIRLKRRLGRIAARKFAGQEDSHMTALMESYILRRKAERAAERAKEKAAAGGEGSAGGKQRSAAPDSDEGEEYYETGSEADDMSLGSAGDDSAFEMDSQDEEDSNGSGNDDGDEEEEEVDIATSRRRAAETKRQLHAGRGGARGGRGRGEARREDAVPAKQFHGRGRGGQRGRGGGRGGGQQRGGRSSGSYQQRSRKVPTRSLY